MNRWRRWLAYHRPVTNLRLRLFCFPYAGGGASTYAAWQQRLPPDVEVCPVQLPGHENRHAEPLLRSMEFLTCLLVRDLEPLLDKPFAFFGHSMGGVIGFELTRLLRRSAAPLPTQLFISATPVPRPRSECSPSDDAFFDKALQNLLGHSSRQTSNRHLFDLMLPVLQADQELCASHRVTLEAPIPSPLTVLGGTHDERVPPESLEGWRGQSVGVCRFQWFPGDHFFIHSARPALLDFIAKSLAAVHRKTSS